MMNAERNAKQADRPRARAILRESLVLLLFVGVTVALTYPVAFQLTSALPNDLGDPLLICWAMGWNYKTILAGHFVGYWDANIFFPTPHALALGDHAFALALLGAPVYWISGNLAAAYNAVFLLSFVLSGYAVYRLARFMVDNTAAAIFAGIAFAFTTYRFDHISHVNLLQTQWPAFTLLSFLAFIRDRKAIHAAGFCLFFIASALSSAYYLILTAVMLAVAFPLVLAGAGRIGDRKLWLGLAAATLVTAAVVAPLALPYVKQREDVPRARSRSTAIHYSARPMSFFTGPLVGRDYAPWLRNNWRAETNFFPGVLPILLGLGCLLYPRNLRAAREWLREVISPGAGKGRGPATREFAARYFLPTRSYRGLLLVLMAAAIVLAMGPKFVIFDKGTITGPYHLLYRHLPGVSGMRVPARFAVFAVIALCALAAYGFADLDRRLAPRRVLRWTVRSVLFAGVIIESASIPLAAVPVAIGPHIPAVYRWLAGQRGGAAIAEIPMGDLWNDVRYMYFSTVHWKPMANGYNAYPPPDYEENAGVINRFPAPEAVALLGQLGVEYVVYHADRAGRPAPDALPSGVGLVFHSGEDFAYQLLRDGR